MHAKNEKNKDYYVRHIYYATHSSFIFQAFLHFTMSRIGIMRDIEPCSFVKNNKIPPSEVGIFTIKRRIFDLFEVKKIIVDAYFFNFEGKIYKE